MGQDTRKQKFEQFLTYFNKYITGSEKREGQIFFDRLLQAFGNAGVKEVGATCEEFIKKRNNKRGFADFIWEPRVIIELKKRGEPLHKYYDQAVDYWFHRIPRLKYMILCNFDEFWIYDLNKQLNDPVHKLNIQELPNNWGALGFLFPKEKKHLSFDNYNIAITEGVAGKIGNFYYSLTKRGINKERAQQFVLQTVVALFSEDVDLIPKYTVHNILSSATKKSSSQKELEKLFLSMASDTVKNKPANYKNIPFFNGGLFEKVEPVELSHKEIHLLYLVGSEKVSLKKRKTKKRSFS